MNDLRNGILDINGFLVTPRTTARELEKHFGTKAKQSPINPEYIFWDLGDQTFFNEGIEFKAYMSFTGDKLDDLYLYPQLPDVVSKYGIKGEWKYPTSGDPDTDLAYFREVREILDKWLEKSLGVPTKKDDRITSYRFSALRIHTYSYMQDSRHGVVVEGGKVTIRYE